MPENLKRFGPLNVDIESIVRSQDVVYEDAGTCWQDGHILGNGDVGAVCYAPYWLEWTINKIDVFDGRNAPKRRLTYKEVMAEAKKRNAGDLRFLDEIEKPDTSNSPKEPLLKSCGQVKLRTAFHYNASSEYYWGAVRPYKIRQTLSLWDAVDDMEMSLGRTWLSGRTHRETVRSRVRSFVDRQSNLVVIRMRDASGALLEKKRLELCRPYDCDLISPDFGSEGDLIWFTQKMPDGSSYAMVMGARAYDNEHCREAGVTAGVESVEQKGDRTSFSLTGDFDLMIAVATSHESSNPLAAAKDIVRRGMRKGADGIEAWHAQWWADFWRKSFVQLDDHPMLEQLWYFGLYQVACEYGRAPVPGLCGLWHGYQDSPFQGFFQAVYTMDQNVQLEVMPVFAANHPELALPFMDTFLNALPRTMEETKALFELPGACYPLEMMFLGGEPSFDSSYRYSLCGGPFCGIIYTWAYKYTRDKDLLRAKVYPFLREVVRFFAAFMEMGEDGLYHLPPTVPAEIFTLSRDAIIDLSLLKPCLQLAIEAGETLGLDDEERKGWIDLLEHYPPYPQKDGIIVDGADIPLDQTSTFPGRLFPIILAHDDNPETWRLVETTFEYILESATIVNAFYSEERESWDCCGQEWFYCAMARLMYGGKKDMLPLLDEQIRQQLKPNGLTPHIGSGADVSTNPRTRELSVATPQNNSVITMILTEMLMQSFNRLIRLFPGLEGKATARFGDLRAEGAFLVSSEMTEGDVRFATITAEVDGTARILNPWSGKDVRIIRQAGGEQQASGEVIHLDMKPGETVTLVCGDEPEVRNIVSMRAASVKVKSFDDGSVAVLGRTSQ